MADNLTISVPIIALGAAAANQIVSLGPIPTGSHGIVAQMIFAYGAGGTAGNFYLQSSVDDGATWFDLMNFNVTTAAANKAGSVVVSASSNPAAITDGSIASNTSAASLLGSLVRIKWTSTGTYTGTTTAKFDIHYI